MDTSSDNAEIELPMQEQLEIYNAHDIDGFMQCWADWRSQWNFAHGITSEMK